jgi:hypothetical protein
MGPLRLSGAVTVTAGFRLGLPQTKEVEALGRWLGVNLLWRLQNSNAFKISVERFLAKIFWSMSAAGALQVWVLRTWAHQGASASVCISVSPLLCLLVRGSFSYLCEGWGVAKTILRLLKSAKAESNEQGLQVLCSLLEPQLFRARGLLKPNRNQFCNTGPHRNLQDLRYMFVKDMYAHARTHTHKPINKQIDTWINKIDR